MRMYSPHRIAANDNIRFKEKIMIQQYDNDKQYQYYVIKVSGDNGGILLLFNLTNHGCSWLKQVSVNEKV